MVALKDEAGRMTVEKAEDAQIHPSALILHPFL
jgi:hypothetical protein